MRTTAYLFIFSLLFTLTSRAASDTFEMALPDAEPPSPSSSEFVSSFQKDLGQTKPSSTYESSTSYQGIPAAEQVSEEAMKGVYESAFSSYRSKTSSDDSDVAAEEWRKGQEKQDHFDLDSLTYSGPVQDQNVVQKSSRKTVQRAPASLKPESTSRDDIPMPEGIDFNLEIESVGRRPASAPEPEVTSISSKDRKALVLQTIADNYGELKSCYLNGLKNSSDMKGKVVMGWSMDTQGRVSGVEVLVSQLNNKQVEKCMAERLAGWRFPRQAKVRGSKDRMTYAFQFVSEKE